MKIGTTRSPFLLALFSFLVFGHDGLAAPVGKIKKADSLLKKGQGEEALKAYDELLRSSPDDPLLNFNAAAAHYGRGDYSGARALYEKALVAENKKLEQAAVYNTGNTFFEEALRADAQDLKKGADLLGQALSYYDKAMRMDSRDIDAKYNYELTERKLDELKKRLKEKEQKQEEKQQGQSAQQTQQQPGKQQEQPQQASKEEKEQQEPSARQTPKERVKIENRQETRAKSADQMTPAEARTLIQQYGGEQKPLQLQDRERQHTQKQVEKDW